MIYITYSWIPSPAGAHVEIVAVERTWVRHATLTSYALHRYLIKLMASLLSAVSPLPATAQMLTLYSSWKKRPRMCDSHRSPEWPEEVLNQDAAVVLL